jgi:hypothetical protein
LQDVNFALCKSLLFCVGIWKIYVKKGVTERRGRVANTLASYLEGPGFTSLPRDRLRCVRVCRGFTQSLKTNARIILKVRP